MTAHEPHNAQSLPEKPRFHLGYLTANDSPHYQADFLNFLNMTRHAPGVERISLVVAISRVRPFSAVDYVALDRLVQMAADCPWFDVRGVIWKGNVGRDFSSAEACLRSIGIVADNNDYVMVRNRSAYGPSRAGWYQQYIAQYERFADTGLVGSTINLTGHPLRPTEGATTHVQTYAYLSQWRHFEPLAAAYPAARCTDRLELINEGELGLSRAMWNRGLGLSCLHWPDEFFHRDQPHATHLPQADIKSTARELSLRYKFPAYLWQPRNLLSQLAWSRLMRRASHQALAHPIQRDGIVQTTLDQYD